MIRKLVKALVIAAWLGGFAGMKLATVAAMRMTVATATMMIPRMNSTIDSTTFREWVAPKAFRPRITKMAPTRTRREPTIPMKGSHPMSVPTSRRRTPVFVRSTCFRRSASQADGRPGIAGGYIGAPAAGAPPAPADRALPQFTQNIVPGVFAAPQRGHVTLVANRPPPPGNLDRG